MALEELGKLPEVDEPGTETVLKELVVLGHAKSRSWEEGVDGWIIRGDGTAELNAVVIRGDIDVTELIGSLTLKTGGYIRTAASGERIEIRENSALGENKMVFYTGHADETIPGYLYVNSNEDGGGRTWLGWRGPDTINGSGQLYFGMFGCYRRRQYLPSRVHLWVRRGQHPDSTPQAGKRYAPAIGRRLRSPPRTIL